MTPFRPEAACPLDGIIVLDLSRLVAGNMLSLQLADFGAEVIKIEDPGKGDPLRHWRVEGHSLFWKAYARNKKSLTLDLRKPRAKELLLGLVERAHVLIENYRPGTLEKMGLATGSAAGPQPAPGGRARLRLGADGALRPEARLRHAGGGHVGLRRQDRLSRPRSGAAADGARRHGGRALRSLCDHGRAARDRDQRRQGAGHRPVAAGADPLGDRRRCGDVQGGGHHPEAPGQPVEHHQPAQRLQDARRPLDLDLGLHAVDGRAPLCRRRRARHDQGPALCRQQRAPGPSRRGRAAGGASSSPATTAPSASPSSRPQR